MTQITNSELSACIRILLIGNVDKDEIIFALVDEHPELFVKYVLARTSSVKVSEVTEELDISDVFDDDVKNQIVSALQNGKSENALNLLRNATELTYNNATLVIFYFRKYIGDATNFRYVLVCQPAQEILDSLIDFYDKL